MFNFFLFLQMATKTFVICVKSFLFFDLCLYDLFILGVVCFLCVQYIYFAFYSFELT